MALTKDKLKKFFFSTTTMTILLLIYASSMAIATFVESAHDTPTAKTLIYDTHWFELIMFWLILIFIMNIKTYALFRREKWPVLTFHLAFIVLFIGGAITRYVSFEGQMRIKEGQTTDEIVTSKSYFHFVVSDGQSNYKQETPYMMSHFNAASTPWIIKRTFKHSYKVGNKQLDVRQLDYFPMAKDSIVLSDKGANILEIVVAGESGRETHYLKEGESLNMGSQVVSFNNPDAGTISIQDHDGKLTVTSVLAGRAVNMMGLNRQQAMADTSLLSEHSEVLNANTPSDLQLASLYMIGNDFSFMVPHAPERGYLNYYKGDKMSPMDKNLPNLVVLELSSGGQKDTVNVFGGEGYTGLSTGTQINGMNIRLGYGSKIIHTPFTIRCDKFLLERYPGSNNPSSYESFLTLTDNGKVMKHHIYMNKILDYRGYRFFQSSYYPDESGTILSVNADRLGTIVTYIGYFFLFGGMLVTLIWKGTRFWDLNKLLKNMHKKSLLLLALLAFGFTGTANAQNTTDGTPVESLEKIHLEAPPMEQFDINHPFGKSITSDLHEKVNIDHADKFAHLLVQDISGRIEPMDSYTLDLLRKMYKKDSYHGLTSEQWFLSMQMDPNYWAKQPIFKVTKKGGDELLKEVKADADGYTSYVNLLDPKTGNFRYSHQYDISFAKREADKNNYDKEIISLTEKYNIFNSIVAGYYMRVVPLPNDPNHTWTSWMYETKDGQQKIENKAYGFLTTYFKELSLALKSNNYAAANQKLTEIENYQKKWANDILPSPFKVNLEIIYNKANTFLWLLIGYSLLGITMVFFAFVELVAAKDKLKKLAHGILKFLMVLLWISFVIHVIALLVRWYLSGHAPWSNGYEAIVFISSVGVFAGLILYKKRNAFIPAAGAIVAMIMMGFAHGGAMLDPQITPLAPVLKSYWLMVHVAVITSSYGFFGLSAVTATLALLMMAIKPSKNIKNSISELTVVNEMAMTMGIFALTIGTFLGGMWANESWGRYWSWDPKETWAFISVIFYAVVIHMRLVPKLTGKWAFNTASMWVVWTVVMTYFGVNYYLTGLHTYATGERMPIPFWVYAAIGVMVLISLISYLGHKGVFYKTKTTEVK